MPELKGAKLYVNLGASQARRRLKGFGHGVRKVQAAGRNKAGQHLDELESQFADVGCSTCENLSIHGSNLDSGSVDSNP